MNGPDSDERPDLDVLYELLASQRRRRVLRVLHETNSTMGVGQLAEHIASVEVGTEEPANPSGETGQPRTIDRVTAGLAHVDLPKLDAADLVRYDRDARTVEATDDLESVIPLLNPFEED